MVRKIGCFVCMLALIGAILCAPVQAATHQVYDNGSLGTTYITYFKDILSGAYFNDNYVAFRSGQYSYTMIVGDLEYTNNTISLVEGGKSYVFSTENSSYNSQYKYSVTDISTFSLDCGDYIIYSDVGDFPQLVERGAKYEMFTAVLLCTALLCVVIGRVLRKR